MLREFRDFVMRGNIVELAVAFIAGVAFNAIVNSLVEDVIMQLVAAVFGKPDFSELSVTLNDSEIRYGAFLTAVTNFLLIMGAVFFFIVKPINALTRRLVAPPPDDAPAVRECPECLTEVPTRARRCRACTAELVPLS